MASYLEVSAVALGSFNPTIFQPEWFRKHELLPEKEIEAATTAGGQRVVVTNDATQLIFDSLRLDVMQERWQLVTSRPDWTKDLGPITSSIFKLLPHTPIWTIGFNYAVHREVMPKSPDKIVAHWAPLKPLAELVGTPLHFGGTVRSTWESYRLTVTLEPSVRLRGAVFVSQNFERTKLEGGAATFCSVIESDWLKVLKRAEEVITQVCEVAG